MDVAFKQHLILKRIDFLGGRGGKGEEGGREGRGEGGKEEVKKWDTQNQQVMQCSLLICNRCLRQVK